jgi:segregation and condensation protein A
MAATLCHLKSRELLPSPEPLEEEVGEDEDGADLDPRADLIKRLLEYQKYKDAAQRLGEQPALGRQVFRRGAPMEQVDPAEVPLQEVSSFELIAALAEVLKRAQVKLTHDVVVDRISITDRINSIVDRLLAEETLRFLECFALAGSAAQIRHEAIVTFLAVLEMARLHMVRILQQNMSGEIYITRTGELHSVSGLPEDYR